MQQRSHEEVTHTAVAATVILEHIAYRLSLALGEKRIKAIARKHLLIGLVLLHIVGERIAVNIFYIVEFLTLHFSFVARTLSREIWFYYIPQSFL